MGLGRRPRQVGYVLRNVFVKGSFHGGVVELVDQADLKSAVEKRVRSNRTAATIHGGLVETGKHTALKMRSRKASGFESLALYQNRDIPVKTCRCGGIGRRRRVMRFDSDAAYPNLLGLSSYP